MHIGFSASVSVKSNFSGPHLSSAALFSRKVRDIEDRHRDDESVDMANFLVQNYKNVIDLSFKMQSNNHKKRVKATKM